MKRFHLLVLCALTASAAAAATPTDPVIGSRVPAFSVQLLDISGPEPKAEPFDSAKTKRLTAYIMVGTRCPTTAAYAERFAAAQREYAGKGVDFVYIYANREDTKDEKIGFHRTNGLGGRLVVEGGGGIARQFGAKRTTEIFLANAEGTVVFHGGIDDSRDAAAVKQQFLKLALEETLAGKPVTTTAAPVFA